MPIRSVGGGQSVGNLTAFLGLDDREFVRGIGRATSSLAGLNRTMASVGRALTTFITLPLIAIGGGAVKAAMDFETAFAKMESLAGVAHDEIDGLRKSVLAMAAETGRGPQELANALYFITSSGFKGAEALDALKVSAQAARVGMGETQVVADLVTAVLNAYGHENLTAANAVDTLTAAVRLGKAEPTLMAQTLGYVIPVAAQMGITFDQVAAAVAAMSRRMSASNVSTAVTNLRQVLSDLLSPAQHSRDALKAWGTSAEELRKAIREKGLLSALMFIGKIAKDDDEAFSDIFGNVRSLTGALELAGVSAEGVGEIFADMQDNTGELNHGIDVVSKTIQDKFNRSVADLKVAGIQLGTELMPIFMEFIGVIKGVAQWFSSLSESSKQLVVEFAAVAAVIGPLLIVLSTMGTLLAGLAGPVGLAIAAVAALATAFIYLYENWEAVKERISDWSWWQNMLIDMIQFLVAHDPMRNLVESIINGLNFLLKINPTTTGIQIPNPYTAVDTGLENLKAETTKYQHQFMSFKDSMIKGAKDIGAAIGKIFPTGKGGVNGGAPSPAATQSPGVIPTALTLPTDYSKGIDDAETDWHGLNEAILEVDRSFQHMITETLVQFGEAIGNLVSGEGGVGDFLNNLLQAVLDFGKEFGKELILAGVAAIAFNDLLLSPGAAIAAGIALVAASSAVSGLLKKGVNGGGKGSSSGGMLPSEVHSGMRGIQFEGYIDGYGLSLIDKKQRYKAKRLG